MCGICGVYNYHKENRIDQDALQKMAKSLAHRGPDGEGFYVNKNIGLGHRRLAIIDLTTGNQPIFNEDKSIAVVLNGEIYNYVELRSELIVLGHRFSTNSDTEVIIHAYEEWGLDCQNRLNGMWAFAIWDNRKNELILSRDRIGEKPLFYAAIGDTFIFASEIKGILVYGFPRQVSLELLEVYLTLGYIPAPFTFYKGINRLKPGHYIVVKNKKITDGKYWDLPLFNEMNMLSNKDEIYEKFEYLLKDSVRLRMRSDVPLGAFLSGGLDSASIVTTMSLFSSLPVETFTIGFDKRDYDERNIAREVARKFKTNHHEETVTLDSFDDSINQVLYHHDEPFGDSSAIAVSSLSKYASNKVKTILTGDGGDEILSGYTAYQGERFASQYQLLPGLIKNLIPSIFLVLAYPLRGNIRYKMNRLTNIYNSSNMPFIQRLIMKNSWVECEILSSLLDTGSRYINVGDFMSDLMANCPYKHNFYRLMYFNFKISLPDDMLTKVDRMSMAYSLETRMPFLDYRLVELMVAVNKDIKMEGYQRKTILRRTVGKDLPMPVLNAPKKGFVVPLREWFKDSRFAKRLNVVYSLKDYGFKPHILREIIDANKNGRRDYGNFIWILIILNKWLKEMTNN